MIESVNAGNVNGTGSVGNGSRGLGADRGKGSMGQSGADGQDAGTPGLPFAPSPLLAGKLRAGLEHLLVKRPGMEKQGNDRNQGRGSLDRSLRLSQSPPSLAKSLGK